MISIHTIRPLVLYFDFDWNTAIVFKFNMLVIYYQRETMTRDNLLFYFMYLFYVLFLLLDFFTGSITDGATEDAVPAFTNLTEQRMPDFRITPHEVGLIIQSLDE